MKKRDKLTYDMRSYPGGKASMTIEEIVPFLNSRDDGNVYELSKPGDSIVCRGMDEGKGQSHIAFVSTETILHIGKYTLRADKYMVTISREDGEGGTFDMKSLEACLDAFWEKEF